MATLPTQLPTLVDAAKLINPSGDGKVSMIVNLLSQTNEMLTDMVVEEGNLATGSQVTQVTGLPEVYYRLANQGVPSSKAKHAQITENAACLEGRGEVDVKVAGLNGDPQAYRMQQNMLFLEAMNQRQQKTMIYGSNSNPAEYVGLANRYSDKSAKNAENILDAGGTGSDNTSVWLCGWSPSTVCGIYPKGSDAGLSHEDLGVGDAFDEDNNRFRAYMDQWKWEHGLALKDWRYVARIANIDISDLEGLTGTQAVTAATAVIKLMSRAIDRMPSLANIRPVFYANRSVLSLLRIMALDKSVNVVTIEEGLNQFGDTIYTTKFLGIPVRLVDQIVNNESQVV